MTNRLTLHQTLVNILGSNNVYYNPPEGQKMKFPCIVYNLTYIEPIRADNIKYLDYTTYKITVVSKEPDHPAIRAIMDLPMVKFSNRFNSNGFYHDVLLLNQKEKQ